MSKNTVIESDNSNKEVKTSVEKVVSVLDKIHTLSGLFNLTPQDLKSKTGLDCFEKFIKVIKSEFNEKWPESCDHFSDKQKKDFKHDLSSEAFDLILNNGKPSKERHDAYSRHITALGYRLVGELFDVCDDVFQASDEAQWRSVCEQVMDSPLHWVLMGSDIVKRSVTRPRLFMPGDSGLMRQICYQPQESPDRSSLSDIITDFIRRTPASAAVRKRTQYIGDLIKSNAKVHAKRGAKDFTVLGIACGECVELAMVGAFPVTYYGNDLDPTALRNAQDIYGIKPLAGDYRVVIRDLQKAAKKFDFITIAGISNYIPTCDSLDSSGKVKSPGLKTIISDLYDLLNNGGTLLVTNFMTGCKERGFMEATMKWNLIYRTVEDMTKLGTDALAGKPLLKEVTVKSDSQERIVYLRISKNGVPPINEDVPLFRTPA